MASARARVSGFKHPKPWIEIEELKNNIEQHGPKTCTEELRRQTRNDNEKERKRRWRGSEFRREARVSSVFFLFCGALGGFAWDTCAHIDQPIRHIKHPANLKSEASKHHLEPGN